MISQLIELYIIIDLLHVQTFSFNASLLVAWITAKTAIITFWSFTALTLVTPLSSSFSLLS